MSASGGASKKQLPLAGISRQRGSALELGARFGKATEFVEEVAANTGEQMVVFQLATRLKLIDQCKAGGRSFRHGDGDGAVEVDDRRRRYTQQLGVNFN